MVELSVEQQILEQVQQLDPAQKQKVLDFARTLVVKEPGKPRGMSGEEFVAFAMSLNFDPEDLYLMEKAIEEGCGRIELEDRINLDDR